jgi:diguanylate cyclase (GGDEF)-like protein
MLAWLTSLDPALVGLLFGLAGLVVSVVIALLGRVGEWSRSLSWWVGASVCITLGFLINVLQIVLPPAIVLMIANPLMVLGACLFLVGVRHLLNQPPQLMQLAPILMVSIVCSVMFAAIWPNLVGRVLTQVACLMVITIMNVSLLRQLDFGYYHFPARFLMVTNALLMTFILLRAITVLVHGGPVSAVVSSPINAAVYGLSGMVILAYLVGVLLLCFAEKQTLLRQLAAEDSLTGVLNRLGLRDALETWPRSGQPGVANVFDIDHFKQVNDGYGHEAGDTLLKTFAQALQATAPTGSIVARLGGDEFCVVETAQMRQTHPDWIERLKQQLPTRLELVAPAAISCKVSHGSARFNVIEGEFSEALRTADRALYRSKARRSPLDDEARAA